MHIAYQLNGFLFYFFQLDIYMILIQKFYFFVKYIFSTYMLNSQGRRKFRVQVKNKNTYTNQFVSKMYVKFAMFKKVKYGI